MKLKLIKSKGFSLVELVVVIAILSLVIVTTVNLFASMVRSQKRILAEQELLNQSSYVIEYMSRAIRMSGKDVDGACLGAANAGKGYLLTNKNADPPQGDQYNGIKFINSSNKNICQEFVWDEGSKRIKESKDAENSVPTYNFLTSDFLQINSFRAFHFKLEDEYQPRVTFFMEIQSREAGGDELVEKIQTTVSQRNLDL